MLAVVQRVRHARVSVDAQVVGAIGPGLLLLLCAEQGDTPAQGHKLLAKLLKLRIFNDAQGKMNHSLQDMDGTGRAGGLLVVSQFTLAADTSSGNRPSFKAAASPADGRRLVDDFISQARLALAEVQCGIFGADMQVELLNDGPVTVPLRIAPEV